MTVVERAEAVDRIRTAVDRLHEQPHLFGAADVGHRLMVVLHYIATNTSLSAPLITTTASLADAIRDVDQQWHGGFECVACAKACGKRCTLDPRTQAYRHVEDVAVSGSVL